MAELSLTKNIPFGLVLIAIGKGGLSEDLKIIPVSRCARESTKPLIRAFTKRLHNMTDIYW